MSNIIKRTSPWNELDYYKEGEKIYGRDEESYKISNGIYNNLQTTIYGQSGIGKTSLLYAGIFPKLRKKDFFPIYIRLGAVDCHKYIDYIIDRIKEEALRIDSSINKYIINYEKIANYSCSIENSALQIWNFIKTTRFIDSNNVPCIPVLVFDQLEEILNNRITKEYAIKLILDLYSLIDDTRVPLTEQLYYSNFRFVFSLREDFLYCLEDIIDTYNLDELRQNRYRISSMSRICAKQVIINTSNDVGGCIEREKIDYICEKILDESSNNMGEISTYMLSLICSTLYINSKDNVIRYDQLDKSTDYLFQYYQSKMTYISGNCQTFLENALITNDGRRSSIDITDAINQGKIDEFTVNKLIESRIVRTISSGEGSARIEFIHDKLTSIIKNKRKDYLQMFIHIINNIFNYKGRSERREYMIAIIFFITAGLLFLTTKYNSSINIAMLYIFIYSFYTYSSTGIRRCHDIGVSGFNFFNPLFFIYTKQSSIKIHKGNLSNINIKSSIISDFSLTCNEFRSTILQTIFILTPILLSLLYCTTLSNIWYYMITSTYFAVTTYFTIKRLLSSNMSAWLICIPLISLIIFVRSFLPFENECKKRIKSGELFLPFLISILIHIVLVFMTLE